MSAGEAARRAAKIQEICKPPTRKAEMNRVATLAPIAAAPTAAQHVYALQ
ncbi:MAG TPA: hypothetical protein VG496_01375 [Myxococcales bacterium]|nr:hypothetical protein [Myxococcales bacterium]